VLHLLVLSSRLVSHAVTQGGPVAQCITKYRGRVWVKVWGTQWEASRATRTFMREVKTPAVQAIPTSTQRDVVTDLAATCDTLNPESCCCPGRLYTLTPSPHHRVHHQLLLC
jgi:hypothetical protein